MTLLKSRRGRGQYHAIEYIHIDYSVVVVPFHIIVIPCIIYSFRKVRPHIFAKKGVGMIIHVNGNHWIRAFVNMESRSISVADSLARRRTALTQCTLIGDILKQYLLDEQHRLV